MPPKRKASEKGSKAKKAKVLEVSDPKAKVEELLKNQSSYCDELGIDLEGGGSAAVFQWLCCSLIFGNRLSEKTTIRAAKGLLNSGLKDPKSVKDASFEETVRALNSEGNVQRGPTMSDRLDQTASVILEKYEGDLGKLRDAAGRDISKEKKLLKEFKGIGEMGLNIFCREAQLVWEELFPYADKRTLDMAKKHGLPCKSAKDLAEYCGNDRAKFVRLLGAVVKVDLRGEDEVDDKEEAAEGDAKDNKKTDKQESGNGNANDEKPVEVKESKEEANEIEKKEDANIEDNKPVEYGEPKEEEKAAEKTADANVEDDKPVENKGPKEEKKEAEKKANEEGG